MKIKNLTSIAVLLILFFLVACSTKKNTFVSRNYHALTTKYNVMYNGSLGYEKGIIDINQKSKNDFWKRLPIEKMQLSDGSIADTVKNANFDIAETKATKAIQKHSMNIGGIERNTQTDRAYLMLGKSRYYEQRFVPAIDAFNYILYKHPYSKKLNEAKIWREKTNMRLGSDAIAIKNLSKLIKDSEEENAIKLKKQLRADANAVLAEAFLNLEQKDSAIAKLQIAEKFTKIKTQKARYLFILGQLYQEQGKKEQAAASYQAVIDMNRKADREYVIQAHIRKFQLFDFQNGKKEEMIALFEKLIKDRENRPFLDVIHHQIGVFYENYNDQKQAILNYNKSLKRNSTNTYLICSNYRNLGNLYFNKPDFPTAAKYYDSTLTKLDKNTREYLLIEKSRKNLDDVIKYDAIASKNDSILKVVAMSDKERIQYYGDHIEKLKKAEEQKQLEKQKKEALENNKNNSSVSSSLTVRNNSTVSENGAKFYFYNPTTVAFGQLEFKKIWGKRSLNTYWRTTQGLQIVKDSMATNAENKPEETEEIKVALTDNQTVEYYLNQLPTDKKVLDSINKERNFAYYQLGIIYKEKFKEYPLATAKLEKLLTQNPEEKWVLPTMYNLYKIYQITDANKAQEMKNKIISEYPNSRYALILNQTDGNKTEIETPEKVYNSYYKMFLENQNIALTEKLNTALIQYSGDEILPKFELLKANNQAKLLGLSAYKKGLEEVATQYPNTDEGKQAKSILENQIPQLEKIGFTTGGKSWKILFRIDPKKETEAKELEEKIKKFIEEEKIVSHNYSMDVYTADESFIVMHNIKSEDYAKDILTYMKANKKFNFNQQTIVISIENYKVVQIKKNLTDYIEITTK